VFGIPGLVETGIVFFWIIWPIFILLLSILIYSKPRRQKNLAPRIFVFSILTIPLGGGFIIGLILTILASCIGYEWPTNYKETFIGDLINAVSLNSRFFRKIIEERANIKRAILVILLVAILSGLGSALYSFNVSKIYPQPTTQLAADAQPGALEIVVVNASDISSGDFILIGIRDRVEKCQVRSKSNEIIELVVGLQKAHAKDEKVTILKNSFDKISASEIIIKGKLYIDPTILLNTLSYISVEISKWLVLSIITYFLCLKLLDKEISFGNLGSTLSYVYIPELLNIALPIFFWNEPMLSKGQILLFVPISWPLIIFYISRIWGFVILVYIISSILESSKVKALGSALAISTVYFLVTNFVTKPLTTSASLRIVFPEETILTVLGIASIMILVSWLLGAFRRE